MNLSQLKKQIDLEKFVVYNKYSIRKDKTTRKWPAYTNGNETIFIHDTGDIKLYFKPDGDRGTIVDFCLNRPELLQNFSGTEMEKVKQVLHQFLQIPQDSIKVENRIRPFTEHPPFALAEYETFEYLNPKNLKYFNYLRSRGISDDILFSPCFRNIGLYYNKKLGYTNIAFPIYNRKKEIEGFDLRNFNLKLFARNSNKSECLWISNFDSPDYISIGESPIDMMSMHQLHYRNHQKHQYIATEGNLTIGQLKFICELIWHWNKKKPDIVIDLGFDNDLAGLTYTCKILLSLLENRLVWPMYSNSDQKRYDNLTNTEFISKVSLNPNIKIISHNNKHQLIYTNDIDTLKFINQSAIKCFHNLKIRCLVPKFKKDWNEELQFLNFHLTDNLNNHPITLKFNTMEKFIVSELPLEIFSKMGLDFEQIQKDSDAMYRILNGRRSRLVKTLVSNPYGQHKELWSKYRLYRDPTDQQVKVYIEYAQPHLSFNKYTRYIKLSEEQEKLILKFGELGEPITLMVNNKPIEALVGADQQLNTLQYTPTNCIYIPDRHYNITLNDDEKAILKKGNFILKSDVKKGDSAPEDKVLYYSNTYDGVISVTPTPELLEQIRQQEEKRNSQQKSKKETITENISSTENIKKNISTVVDTATAAPPKSSKSKKNRK